MTLLSSKATFDFYYKGLVPRGISLLESIPVHRNCHQASIPLQYCAGSRIGMIPPEAMAINTQNFTSAMINYLNNRILIGDLKQKCTPLVLSSIRHAEVYCESLRNSESSQLLLTFCTNSNKACFDALIEYSPTNGTFRVLFPLEPANEYSMHSQCVTTLKEYCVCA